MHQCMYCKQMINKKNEPEMIHVFQKGKKSGKPYGHQYFCNVECAKKYFIKLVAVRWGAIRNLWATYKGKTKKLGPLMDELIGYKETKKRPSLEE